MATVHIAGAVPSPPMRVVVVVATMARARQLERLMQDPGFVVAGVARDPETAERLVFETRPGAVLLDLELLDGGLEAIERIMATRPTPIVVCGAAAGQPQAALAAGAVDVVGPLDAPADAAEFAAALVKHLKMASRVPVITHPRARLRARQSERVDRDRHVESLAAAPDPPKRPGQSAAERADHDSPVEGESAADRADRVERAERSERAARSGDRATDNGAGNNHARVADARKHRPLVVAIGASTGGPPALATILRDLPADLPAAIVIAQHMAEGFVEGLARWLDDAAGLSVHVAKGGEQVHLGHVYLAPAGLNLAVRPGFRVELTTPPAGQYHVPGVDAMFASVARLCGARSVGVLLTGMGRDGANGLLTMRDAGARTLAQDEATSVVWGMPQAAMALGAVDLELSLGEISAAIVTAVDDCIAGQVAAGGAS